VKIHKATLKLFEKRLLALSKKEMLGFLSAHETMDSAGVKYERGEIVRSLMELVMPELIGKLERRK